MMQHDLKKTNMFPFDIYFMHDILCLFSDFLVVDLSRARSNLPGNLSMSSWVRELEDCRFGLETTILDLLCEVII